MILKLVSSEKAKVFGVPEQDITEADLVSFLVKQNSWSEDSARKHIESAIASGVFAWLDEKGLETDAIQIDENSAWA